MKKNSEPADKNHESFYKALNFFLGLPSLFFGLFLSYLLGNTLIFLIKFPSVYDPRDGAGIIFVLFLILLSMFYFVSFYKTAVKQKLLWVVFSLVLAIPAVLSLIMTVFILPIGGIDQTLFAQRCVQLNTSPITAEKVISLNGYCGKMGHYPSWRARQCTAADLERTTQIFDHCIRPLRPEQRDAFNTILFGEETVEYKQFLQCAEKYESPEEYEISRPMNLGLTVWQENHHGSQVHCSIIPKDDGYEAKVGYFTD